MANMYGSDQVKTEANEIRKMIISTIFLLATISNVVVFMYSGLNNISMEYLENTKTANFQPLSAIFSITDHQIFMKFCV